MIFLKSLMNMTCRIWPDFKVWPGRLEQCWYPKSLPPYGLSVLCIRLRHFREKHEERTVQTRLISKVAAEAGPRTPVLTQSSSLQFSCQYYLRSCSCTCNQKAEFFNRTKQNSRKVLWDTSRESPSIVLLTAMLLVLLWQM